MKKIVWFVTPLVIAAILWEVVSRSGAVSTALFPHPSRVFAAWWAMAASGTLLSDIGTSIWRLAIGLLLGASLGVVVGLGTGRLPGFSRSVSPLIQCLRPLPPVALIPLFIVWFGIGDPAKIISIAFATFFPVWVNTHIGAERIPQTYLWSARLLSIGRVETVRRIIIPQTLPLLFRGVIFPGSLPFIIAGIRVSIGLAFIMVFVSELAGASAGIGYRISVAHLAYRIDEMMAALLVLGIAGALTDQACVWGARRVFPWLDFKTS